MEPTIRTDDIKSVTIYPKFLIGDVVYLKMAEEKWAGMVIGYNVRPQGIAYIASWPDGSNDCHYDIELTKEFIPDYGTAEENHDN